MKQKLLIVGVVVLLIASVSSIFYLARTKKPSDPSSLGGASPTVVTPFLQAQRYVGCQIDGGCDAGTTTHRFRNGYFTGSITAGSITVPVIGSVLESLVVSNAAHTITTTINADSTSTFPYGMNIAGSGGRVGIGTTAPGTLNGVSFSSVKLHTSNTSASNYIAVNTDLVGGDAGILFNRSGANANNRMWAIDSQPIPDNTNSALSFSTYSDAGTPTPLLTMLRSGNVGIGTTTPNARLNIVGATIATSSNTLTIYNASSTQNFTIDDAGNMMTNNSGLYYEATSSITYVNSLQTGPLNFDDDAGVVGWTDMAVSSSLAGTELGEVAQINSFGLFEPFAIANGSSGGVSQYGLRYFGSLPYTADVAVATTSRGIVEYASSTSAISGSAITMITIPLPATSTIHCDNTVVAVGATSTANHGSMDWDFIAYRDSATANATQLQQKQNNNIFQNTGMSATTTYSGANVLVQVIGLTTTTINWVADSKCYVVTPDSP